MRPQQLLRAVGGRLFYLLQRTTGLGFDRAFERHVRLQAEQYLSSDGAASHRTPPVRKLESLDLENRDRFSVTRGDIYKRFHADRGGSEKDDFGRTGRWIPRGCVTYVDSVSNEHVKIFDEYYCGRGEGRFLPLALERGVYDFLCPGLSYIVEDESGNVRGYAIASGRPLTRFDFERLVGTALRSVICDVTARTGLYFYDLEFHNVVRHGDQLSLIDLESVLPVEWYGEDKEFSIEHLDVVDIGWPIQTKWRSPRWYRAVVHELKQDRLVRGPTEIERDGSLLGD